MAHRAKADKKSWARRTRERLTGGERVAYTKLSALKVVNHLVATENELWAWYSLTPQQWSFRTASDRTLVWDQIRYRFASLAGHAIQLRVSSKPFPTYEFARKLAEDTSDPLPPDTGDAGDFDLFLERQQRRLAGAPIDQTVSMLGVRLQHAPDRSTLRSLHKLGVNQEPSEKLAKLLEELRRVTELVAGPGLGGQPLTPQQMAWLFRRSVSMGMPVQLNPAISGGVWEEDDLYAFTDPVEWIYKPLGSTVRVEAKVAGKEITRHVAVASVGRMPSREFPEDNGSPWMLATAGLGYPVEWNASGYLIAAADLTARVDYDRQRAVAIRKHYSEHDELPPPAVDRAIGEAVETYDEVTEGEPRDAVRFEGTIRAAVYGTTERECLERVRNLMDIYASRHRIELSHGGGQRESLREFIPGESWSKVGFQRKMSTGYFAAALPHVSSSLGTPTGPYIGHTSGTARRAVLFDGHYAMENLQLPGVYPMVADPGAGKSFGMGLMAGCAVERGEPTILLDPSGPLGRLTKMPRFAPHSRLLNLTDSAPGTLSPWQLIPQPERWQFESDRDYDYALRRADAERRQLGYDTFRMLLPETFLREPAVDHVLRETIRNLGGGVDVNPLRALQYLEEHTSSSGDAGVRVARVLRDAAEFPLGELIFPATLDHDFGRVADDKRLVVITMPGIVMPAPGLPREQWSVEEMYGMPLLHLAAFYTSRYVYGRDMKVRKNIFMDENHIMGTWGSGRALMMRLSRDSRKWNTMVVPSSQHPDDILGVGKIESLIGGAFVGRIEDPDTALAAMRLVRSGAEYAQVVQKLSPRPAPGSELNKAITGEFVMMDPLGRVDKMRFDASWYPELEEVLNTTPGGHARVSMDSGPSPFIEEARDLFANPREAA